MIKRRYLFLLLVPLAVISLFTGVGEMNIAGLLAGNIHEWQLFWTSRLPRLMAILVAGAGLSVCGLIMQSLSRNRFVSPTTAGLYDCARLGVLISIILLPAASIFIKTGFAILVTLAGALVFMSILATLKHRDTVFVPLVGMIFGSIISAFTTFIALQMDLLQNLAGWLQGDFSTVLNGQYELIYLSVPILIVSYFLANRFVLAGIGEDFATNLGLNYKQTLFLGLVLVSVITGVVIVTVGAIPFLGLIVPNIVSLYLGDNIRKTLSHTAILGALLVLVCDLFGRIVIYPYEVSVSLIMGVLGSVLFLWLLLRRYRYA
ncbi:ABC transporter permease [Acinetobacter radioresistens]|uniref:ABC transporter permease n=1 Tax=Acinetobacter radioresistens TaxID=40216 RepID=UPI00202FBBA6|nr:iron chelate uptake ABC transporter family permease subunit [Acinetobacter radioresistens]MCM1935433.1 iron chelate uptake ABC transporter family permease subunit [Acinetobacter radioresistens]MCM1953324.1 iron chelate uptake ABC transporter family permease subunit [Acinetobacter radioresistens]MCU4308989.1 iron chelate uptake ABC transporter family permease subunit [Acinetobacter radioresistens]MCU4567037.1 iron chelate uptake ABC transporter family permease subunit [Acinetobacter radioresi